MPEQKVVGEVKLEGVGYVVYQKSDGRYFTDFVTPDSVFPRWGHWGSIRLLNEMQSILGGESGLHDR